MKQQDNKAKEEECYCNILLGSGICFNCHKRILDKRTMEIFEEIYLCFPVKTPELDKVMDLKRRFLK